MKKAPLLCRIHARLHCDERGFSMVEAMVAGMVLAVGAFAIAQSLQFGLKTTGIARQRAAAESYANQQMEAARSLNYGSALLGDATAPAHSISPNDPDYYVTGSGSTLKFDPDGPGPLSPELIVFKANASPSLIHHETSIKSDTGNTTFSVYRYVTWVDSPIDGCAQPPTSACPSTVADTTSNPTVSNGVDDTADANGKDMKRVTIVVTWPNSYGAAISQLRISSLFSIGNIPYHGTIPIGTDANVPPSVQCPTWSAVGKDASFTAQATDSDGISDILWAFGDGGVADTGTNVNTSHHYGSQGDYTITNTVFDVPGAQGDNSALNCTIHIDNNQSGGTDVTAPTGSSLSCPGTVSGTATGICINLGASYTTSTALSLTLAATDNANGSGMSQMQFSNDGTTYGAAQAYVTSTSYTLPSGAGLKTVYVKFVDAAGNVSEPYQASITLDTTPPGAPTAVLAVRTKISGSKVDITVSWNVPSPNPSDLGGFRIYRLASTQCSTCYVQIGGDQAPTARSYADNGLDKALSYTYCLSALDIAGNEGARACFGPM